MDDILQRFLAGQSIKREVIAGGTTDGRIVTEYERPNYKDDEVPEATTRYAKNYTDKIREEIWRRFDIQRNVQRDKREESNIYQKYAFAIRVATQKLPIEDYRFHILDTIRDNTVVILRGPTGCGKTTQVPQFILDEYREKGLFCNIVVAQPRRIAASSNAKRVCKERGWPCGSLVGYQVGSDHRENCSEDTRILFCTTGVLVEKIIHGDQYNPLDKFTHIILDEVHERDKDMDFLMIAIYKYLNPKIRVILMSATIDVDKFARYYQVPSNDFRVGKAPVIELGYERNFHVEKVFLDEIEGMECTEQMNMPEISEQMYRCALRLIALFERVDRIHSEFDGIESQAYENKPKPTVLVFLPGIFEIKQMYQRLEEWRLINNETKILRIVMHSTADPLLSELAMQKSDKNTRKIILATNIAESSITVPDVKYVIDFCLTRNLVVNPMTNFPSLQLAWASRDNCEQRAGRTGRVMNGWCFRLVSRHFYDHEMRQSAKAEMITSPLENIILKTKQLNMGTPEEVLALALDKPPLNEIHNAVLRLKEMGAMLKTTRGKTIPRDGDITYIGEIMSKLPIDVKLSKLIALGYCFGVLEECIIIAAALNSKNMFKYNRSFGGIDAYTKRLEFADGSGSDLFALLNAYKKWIQLRNQGEFGNIKNPNDRKNVKAAEKEWAESNYLEIASLRECDEYVKDLRVRVKRMNLIDCSKCDVTWNRNEKYIVLKVVISGAFYPNYFSRSTNNKRESELEAEREKTLGGRDSSDTVYFSGFKYCDLPHIYIQRIKDILVHNHVISQKDAHTITVSHDGVSERVFVSFKKTGKEGDIKKYGVACHPGFVLTEVYKAVKLRTLKLEHSIEVLSDRNTALSYAQSKGLMYTADGRVLTQTEEQYSNVCYPKRNDKYVHGYISHTENCGRFWFQPTKYLAKIRDIFEEINNPNSDLEVFGSESEVAIGQVLAAVFPSDNNREEFYRAKVLSVEKEKATRQITLEVRFIDFGNTRKCELKDLRRFRGVSARFLTLPPYCYQCALAFIQPSQVNAPDGVWRQEANHKFVEMTDGIEVKAEIYSVVNGVARVFLSANNKNINAFLIDISAAEHCEEGYMSKFEFIEREIARNEERSKQNYLTQGIIRHLQEEEVPTIEPPTRKDGRMHTVTLKGPYSPLEIGLYGLANSSSGTPRIEEQSVNNVLLENEPNDMSEKYLVAVTTHQHDENAVTTVRQTTMMPNIRLFAPMMAAIFAPAMKLERNKLKTHYIQMLSGLGCDDRQVCLSPNSNMKFNLEADLKNTDLEMVNSIRTSIDRLLSDKCFVDYSKDKVLKIMRKLQDDLISLLSCKRLLIRKEYTNISWGPYKKEDQLPFEKSRYEYLRILPRHQLLQLSNPELDYLFKMEKHHEELEQKQFSTNDNPTNRSPICHICNVEIDKIRMHLISRQHKDGIKWIKDLINAFSRQ